MMQKVKNDQKLKSRRSCLSQKASPAFCTNAYCLELFSATALAFCQIDLNLPLLQALGVFCAVGTAALYILAIIYTDIMMWEFHQINNIRDEDKQRFLNSPLKGK